MSMNASRPKPFRDDLEKNIVMEQGEIDALEWIWGMGDFDRCLQNLELERRRQESILARYEHWTPDHTIEEWCAELQAKLKALDALSRESVYRWRRISSAPKDGTEIIALYMNQGKIKKLVHYSKLHGYWMSKGEAQLGLEENATHWTHIPELNFN